MSDLRKFALPLPPLEEQRQIVSMVQRQMQLVKAVGAMVSQNVCELERLDQSILAKAFRGELVPQDPDDEPASVLLERIRAERAAEGGGKPRRGRRKAGA